MPLNQQCEDVSRSTSLRRKERRKQPSTPFTLFTGPSLPANAQVRRLKGIRCAPTQPFIAPFTTLHSRAWRGLLRLTSVPGPNLPSSVSSRGASPHRLTVPVPRPVIRANGANG